MKLERPGDRPWPVILLSIALGLGIFAILCDNGCLSGGCFLIALTLIAVSITSIIISDRDDTLFTEAEQKSQAVRAAEKKAFSLEAEKIHLEHQVESVAAELQHLKEKYKSLQEEDQDLQRENATLREEILELKQSNSLEVK